jgi:hypothetical protein
MQKKWLKEYGPVVGLMYGSHPVIAVIDGETCLEVFRRDEFQGRPDNFNSRDRAFNKRLGNTRFLKFSIDIILPIALWHCGRFSL